MTAALILPALALAIDVLARRWKVATLALALVLIAVPWNVSALSHGLPKGYFDGLEAWVATAPTYPGIAKVPAWVEPNQTILGTPDLTVGWLRQAAADHKLPAPQQLKGLAAADLPLQLGVAQRGGPSPRLTCRTYTKPLVLNPPVGTVWRMATPVAIQLAHNDRPASFPSTYAPVPGQDLIEITLPDLQLLVTPGPFSGTFELCT